jgi:2,3-dihydroxybenzoate decarboxylase
MQGKIGLEEHFAIAETIEDSRGFLGEHIWPELKHRLSDLHAKRIALMDKHGMELMVLSLNAPAIQAIVELARQ